MITKLKRLAKAIKTTPMTLSGEVKSIKKTLGLSRFTDINIFDKNFGNHGLLRSTKTYTDQEKFDAQIYFQFREKNDCTLTACSSWYGGDYLEFGAVDLATFCNMLSAFSLFQLHKPYPDTKFYAFDVFGSLESEDGSLKKEIEKDAGLTHYFEYFNRGDSLSHHQKLLENHGLYVDQCHLIKGFFQDTFNKESFIEEYKKEGRSIGFAFLDCNIGHSYKYVFENIFDIMNPHSYIYMDEYLQNHHVIQQFDIFIKKLREFRNLGCVYVRPAAGFGALFRVYPLADNKIEKDLCDLNISSSASYYQKSKSIYD